MKYRVKFKCYWYNTGMADNHSYINYEDFDTLEEAQAFKARVDEQFKMSKKEWKDPPYSDYEIKYDRCITYPDYKKWADAFDWIEIENGFIESEGTICKFYPEVEEAL